MNVKLLEEVRDHIAQYPESYTFNWGESNTDCGTKACVAGWTIMLGKRFKTWKDTEAWVSANAPKKGGVYSTPARRLLKITKIQARRLFLYWPDGFCQDSPKDAVARINRFIETKGAE